MKVKLEVDRRQSHFYLKGIKPILTCLPYYKSRNVNAKYFHRVRSSDAHFRNGKLHHVSVSFWCGGAGFVGKKGVLSASIPEDGVLCAVCEGKAIGAGYDGSRAINGRSVMYSPRDRNKESATESDK